jgi:hypothetical protein
MPNYEASWDDLKRFEKLDANGLRFRQVNGINDLGEFLGN